MIDKTNEKKKNQNRTVCTSPSYFELKHARFVQSHRYNSHANQAINQSGPLKDAHFPHLKQFDHLFQQYA